MTDTVMQKQFDNEKEEAVQELVTKKTGLFTKIAVTCVGLATMAAGAYYAYGILFPDPWYVRAMSFFGF